MSVFRNVLSINHCSTPSNSHHKQKPELGHDFCLVRDDSTEKIPMYAEFYANDTTKKKEVDTKRAFFASF